MSHTARIFTRLTAWGSGLTGSSWHLALGTWHLAGEIINSPTLAEIDRGRKYSRDAKVVNHGQEDPGNTKESLFKTL